ncbi:MAG: 30S ribosomal protein S20 [bacterium]|nr:30S ribosomal protein S20 [bacterium]MXY75656.1 30S ribosomal protein S20 [Acidimicrobiia bacterium]
MPHTKSQEKRDRQAIANRGRNRAIRSELKTRTRHVEEAAASGDREAAEQALRIAQKRTDQAVAKGVLKKNTANRRKAKLERLVSSL